MLDLDRLQESPHLLDLLVQMEDVLDSNDIYVFENWFRGEIVEGPVVRRYWLNMTLRYPIDKMPDPQAAKRLMRLDVRVDYDKVTIKDENYRTDALTGTIEKEEGQDETHTHWEVRISIPRRLISDMNAEELDFYDEDIEMEDVQDAQDEGMSDESAYQEDAEGSEGMTGEEGEPTPEEGKDAVNF